MATKSIIVGKTSKRGARQMGTVKTPQPAFTKASAQTPSRHGSVGSNNVIFSIRSGGKAPALRRPKGMF